MTDQHKCPPHRDGSPVKGFDLGNLIRAFEEDGAQQATAFTKRLPLMIRTVKAVQRGDYEACYDYDNNELVVHL